MKILWITNILLPDICIKKGWNIPFSGGWIESGAKRIKKIEDIQLAIATVFDGDEFYTTEINEIQYFLIPKKSLSKKNFTPNNNYWKIIDREYSPDVVHIHGTEKPHFITCLKAFNSSNVVASVQGLVSVCERYYFSGIEEKVLHRNVTFRDRIRFDTFFSQKTKMREKGKFEIELIKDIKNVIGRTSWDKTHTWAINPTAEYYFCNETLRDEFYNHEWRIDNSDKHTIFLSQAHYPLKGLHKMIEALPLILKKFPDTIVYVAGNNFFTNRGWRINGYGKLISRLLNKLGVANKVKFTGILNEKEMCNQFLKAHVFVCPSSIENSPNSLGEAQLLGVPCIASYVGGVPDMVKDGETGLLYQFEEHEMLAASVCKIFSDDELAKKLSDNEKQIAKLRHDKVKNAKQLHSIYERICKK